MKLDDAYSGDAGANVTSMSKPAAVAGTYTNRGGPLRGRAGSFGHDAPDGAAARPLHPALTLTVTQP